MAPRTTLWWRPEQRGDPDFVHYSERYAEVEPEWLTRQIATNARVPFHIYLEAGLLTKPSAPLLMI